MRIALLLVLILAVVGVSASLLAKEAAPDDLVKTGDDLYARKTYKQALAAYEAYLKAEPKGAKAHHVRMRIARCLLGVRQRWQAVERLKKFIGETEKNTLERAQIAQLLGSTQVRYWGGRAENIAWLDEAEAYFASKEMTAQRIAVLFDIAVGLSHSWGYDINYKDWEKEHYQPNPNDVKVSWDEYRKQRMKKVDDERYARVVKTYESIVKLADGGTHAAMALYRLGCFHVNVLAQVFSSNANYYAGEYEGEKPEEMEKALDRYHGEIQKGLAAWKRILEKHGDGNYADDAQYLIAVTHHHRLNDFRAALTEYESLLAAFPGSEWGTTVKAGMQLIRKEEIRLQVDHPFRPDENPVLGLSARNVRKIKFRAYRLDMASLMKGAYRFHQLDGISTSNLTPYKEWEIETGVAEDYKGVQGPLKLPFAAAGAFLLVAEGERTTCRALVVSSEVAMAMKTSPEMALFFATDSISGEPKAGVRVVVKANWRAGPLWLKKVFEATSDESGLARVDLTGLPARSVYLEAVGTLEDHVALSRNYRSSPRGQAAYKVFSMTDRPVYRPNQTVHMKSIVRTRGKDGLVAKSGQAVLVEVQNPRGEKIFSKTLVTNDHGSFSADLALGEEPPLGMYNVRTFIDGNQYYSVNWVGTQFRVEEYKKPEFEVKVDAGEGRIEPGSKVKAKVAATYYFGAPVAHGKLTYQVFRQPYRHHMPVKRRYQWYYEDIYPTPRHWWGRELVTEGEAALAADGTFEIEFDAKKYEDGNDSQFFIEAKVTDQSRREISGSAAIFSTVKPYFVQTESQRSLYKPGDKVEITIKAEDANRNPVASAGKLVLTKRVDREEEKDGEKVDVTEWKEVGSVPAKTAEDGTGIAGMIVDEPGQFTLSYVVMEGDVEIRHGTSFWAVTKDFRGSQYRFSNVEVLTDRDTYAKGDEIEVLVNSHVKDAWILLTVEAGPDVLFSKVVKAAGKSHLEKLTVDATWIPNVWVKALTIRDGAVFLNRRQIVVPPVSKFLDVSITAAKKGTYLPGEEAEFTVTATNPNGEPAEAELAIGFIDKSILYIQPEITPDIRKFFYGEKRGDQVRVSSSFDFRYHGSERARPGHSLTKYRTQGWPEYMRPWWYNFAGMTADLSVLYHKGVEHAEKLQGRGGKRGGWGFTAGEGGGDAGGEAPSGAASPPGARAPGAPAKKERMRRASNGRPDESRSMDKEEMELKDSDDFGGDGGSGAVEPKVRKFFPDTAFWNAHVTTGKNGQATVKFTFPDSLTTWKATAHGATVTTGVGTGRGEFVTTKNIIIRLQAPRFFRERDELVVSGIVHNYFDEEVDVTALIKADGGCLELLTDRGELSKPELSFKVAAKKEQRVDWWFRVTGPGRATVRIDARTKRESDAMVLKFPVYEHGVEKYIALSGSMVGTGGTPAGDGAAEMSFLVPDDRHEESTDLTVTINPSIAAAMLETLPYLADYPYGCVEQTMSRFLPSVVVKKTLLDLGYSLADLGIDPQREVPSGYWGRKEVQKLKVLREEDLAKVVGAGLKRLADFQNSDGSWGWFKGSSADLRMTSYVVSGLIMAGRSGAPVDKNMIQRGATFLWRQVQGIDPDHLAEKGMPISPDLLTSVVTVLADGISMKGEAGARVAKLTEWIYGQRENLGAVSRARLARTLHKIGKTEEALIVCENLTDQMELDRENGTCRFGRTAGYYRWYNDAVEGTSEALKAYLVVEPKSELIPMMVKWIVGSRRGAHWKSTMDTAHAVLALCDYLKVSKELAPDLTVTVRIGDRVTKTIRITKENVFTLDNTITIRGADLAGGTHVVSIEKKGTGNLYYSGALTVFTREEDVKAAGNEIAIERKLFRIIKKTREKTVRDWVKDHYVDRKITEAYEEKEPLGPNAVVKVGDEILVTLAITAKNDYRYLVFEDLKGAGFEPTELRSGHGFGGILTYREFRDERAVFFCSSLRQGKHELSYRLRAEIPGDYHVMPAQGHAMYLPDVRATSDEWRVQVSEPGVR